VKVQISTTDAATVFQVDDWVLEVETDLLLSGESFGP